MSRLDTKKVLVEDLNKIAQEAFSVIAVDYRGTNVPWNISSSIINSNHRKSFLSNLI